MLCRKGQALQFNWILEKGGFVLLPDGTFGVDFVKVLAQKSEKLLKLLIYSVCQVANLFDSPDKKGCREPMQSDLIYSGPG